MVSDSSARPRAGYVFGLTSDRLAAQAPTPQAPAPNKSWVGMIYGQVPVTREELGEFLIARGGYEKVDLLVNKKIIEVEAARRNIGVTGVEVRAGARGRPAGAEHLVRRLQSTSCRATARRSTSGPRTSSSRACSSRRCAATR